jgi:hypothetical protein
MSRCKFKDESKGEVHPVTAIKAQMENRRVTSTFSLTSALEWGGRSKPLSCHLTMEKDIHGYPLYKRMVGPKPSMYGCGKSHQHRDSIPKQYRL